MKTSVLLVDDRPENLVALGSILDDMDLDIVTAASGEEALGLLLDREYAIVLMDVQMPGMDGFETAELMRGRKATRSIPVIFVTAISKEQHYVFKGYESGAVDYLSKPLDPMIVRSKVNVFVELFNKTKKLQEITQIAEEAVRTKSEFLANMSHEIRTPMNAVIGMSDLLMETTLTAEQKDYASTIHVSGEALLMLINDILDFSKIEAGEMTIESRDFELAHCVESALDLMVPRATEKGLELVYEIEGSVPSTVCGDEGRLRQILLNLLGNAIKFTSEGEVGISVQSEPAGCGDRLTFTVHDTGIGIEKGKVEHIFDMFSQADASTTRQYGGTGLGLSISRRLSELMGGCMWAESTLGLGSNFKFSVQMTPATLKKTIQVKPVAFSPPNRKVLVVDDNATNIRIIEAQLTRWGLVPISFLEPELALKTVEAGEEYGLMITDMQMPKMDGAMLIEAIRKHLPAKKLPIIMLTSIGLGRPSDLLDLSAYLLKPAKPVQLHKAIVDAYESDAFASPKKQIEKPKKIEKSDLKILLVEDNLVNQKVATLMLRKMGYQADVANDGIEALEKTEATPYDVVFMDIQMPRMDGLTATKTIKERDGATAPLIVGMSAHAMQEERERGLAIGMDDYLTKPIQMLKLQELLQKIDNQEQI